MRAFIAIELPEAIKEKLCSITADLKKKIGSIKWVEKDNLHLTLKFLGDIKDDQLADVSSRLKDVCSNCSKYEICIKDIGGFPSLSSPRIVWAGLNKGKTETQALAEEIDKKLFGLGIKKEENNFKAHITLGRNKERRKAASLSVDSNIDIGSFYVNEVSLIKSTLLPKGPVYQTLEKIKLK